MMRPRWLRLMLVDLIVRLWIVMPRRARFWAFMNDDLGV